MGTAKVFQVSDLANNRTEFIDEARSGLARLRDKDGTSLVMMPEARLAHLQRLQDLNEIFLRLSHLVTSGKPASPIELGQHSWLRVFDMDDLREFTAELEEALAAAVGDGDTAIADEVVGAWRVTARQLSDPLRRSILLGPAKPSDFTATTRPTADGGDAPDE